MPADTQVDIVPTDEFWHSPGGTEEHALQLALGLLVLPVVWQRACSPFPVPRGAILLCSILVWRLACMVPDCWSQQTHSLKCCRAWRQHSRSPTGLLHGLIPVPLGLFFGEIVAPK